MKRTDGKLQQLHVALQTASPTGNFLAEFDRSRVLKVCSARLDDPLVLFLQAAEGCDQRLDRRDQLVLDCDHGGNVHCRREGVIGGLAHVDIIVRVAKFCARQLIGAVGNDLVRIHIRLRARAGLPDHQRKMLVELARDHLVASPGNHPQLFRRHFFGLQFGVCHRRCALENAERVRNLARHRLCSDADEKILMASLGLRRPELVCGDFDLAHRIVFNPVFHLVHLRCSDC